MHLAATLLATVVMTVTLCSCNEDPVKVPAVRINPYGFSAFDVSNGGVVGNAGSDAVGRIG